MKEDWPDIPLEKDVSFFNNLLMNFIVIYALVFYLCQQKGEWHSDSNGLCLYTQQIKQIKKSTR